LIGFFDGVGNGCDLAEEPGLVLLVQEDPLPEVGEML
jgi:hypothetical protein